VYNTSNEYSINTKLRKVMVNEDDNPQNTREQLDFCKKNNLDVTNYMTVIPVNFGAGGGRDLLWHTKELLE
jgi:hypothetical protein